MCEKQQDLTYRTPGPWTSRPIRPIDGPRRGRLAITRDDRLLFILPETTTPTLRILQATKLDNYASYEEIWLGTGLTGEPLIDGPRLESDNVLSVFIKKSADGSENKRNVVLLDFDLEELE